MVTIMAASMTDDDELLPARVVRALVGHVSDMTLGRWERNPLVAFPQPIKIGSGSNARRYWRRGDIDQFIKRRRAAVTDPASAGSR